MHLPHLRPFSRSPIVFLTTCTERRVALLANEAGHTILRMVWLKSGELNGWFVGRYVVMPDHVHLFAQPGLGARSLADWMRTWKSIAAVRINRVLHRCEPVWQPDYFDRYLRSSDDYRQKWEYVAMNPVRKGLVSRPDDWPFGGVIHDLRHREERG